MTDLPRILDADPLPPIAVLLPSRHEVVVQRLLRRETRTGDLIARQPSCWAPNKPSLIYDGTSTWAEFILVRRLEAAGWDARWIKNWTGGREFCTDVGSARPLPGPAAETIARIDRRAASASGGGAWDIVAWRGDEYLFLESKQHKSGDKLRPGQIAWLAAGLAKGFALDRFAVVEYDAGPKPG